MTLLLAELIVTEVRDEAKDRSEALLSARARGAEVEVLGVTTATAFCHPFINPPTTVLPFFVLRITMKR
jgi:hypothetical protein